MLPIILKSVAAKILAASAVGLGGYEAWKHFYPKVQSLRTVSSSGHPVQVVVPVKTIQLPLPGKGQAVAPVPSNNGTQAYHIPPPPSPTGQIALEPTVITPTGAANLSVDNVSDIQNALNALGWSPPLKADGIVGPLTSGAIKSFESSHGLPVDGQASPVLRSAIQTALGRIAGTQAHIGQSLPIQSAPQTINGASSPIAQVASAAIQSPAAKSLMNSGLSAVASLFSDGGDDSADTSADSPSNSPKKDAIQALQHALNMLGCSPPLDENGNFNPETVAAVRTVQITFGLAADGIPGPKTATTIAVALDPAAQQAIVPSVTKAADHVDALAVTAPPSTAPALANAATDLKATAAATPVPTEVQTHASTAAAQAATASSAAPPGVAEPLADAAHSLAAATTTPVPDPTHLAAAASSTSNAAVAAQGSTSAPSLAAAADHLASAAAAPDTATQGDHLNAAAAHLANAATGAPSPTSTAVAASGEFGGFMSWLSNWWKSPQHFWHWHARLHPTYTPAIPAPPSATMRGEFGWAPRRGGLNDFGHERGGWRRRQQWRQQQQAQQAQQGQGGQPPYIAPPPPQDDSADAGFGWGGWSGAGGGRGFAGTGYPGAWPGGPGPRPPWGGWGGGIPGGFPSAELPNPYLSPDMVDSDFGYIAPPTGGGRPAPPPVQNHPTTAYMNVAPPPPPVAVNRPYIAPPTGTLRGGVFQPSAYGQSLGMQPQALGSNANYWRDRQQTLGLGYGQPGYGPGGYGVPYDRRWATQYAQQSPGDWRQRRWAEKQAMLAQQAAMQPPPGIDPNAINPYVDPNANNPAVQDPSLDAQSNGGAPQADDNGGGD
jgi:peptidoglycan hydrolase-like protein with peptidoglycan-binding domain